MRRLRCSVLLAALLALVGIARAQGTYVAPLTWTTPVQNVDGSTLTDLASYRIIYGQSLTALNQQITVAGTINQYNVPGLTAGVWYFEVITVSASGAQSVPTNPVSVTCPCSLLPVPNAPTAITVN